MRIAMPTIWFHRGQTEVTKTFKKVFEELGHEVFIHARMGGVYNQPKLEFKRHRWEDGKTLYYGEYNLSVAHSDGSISSDFLEEIKEQKIDLVFFNEEYDWNLVGLVKSQGFKVATYLDFLHKNWIKNPSPLAIYDLVVCSTKRAYEMCKNISKAKWVGWGMDIEKIRVEYPWKNRPYLFFENAGWLGINDRKGMSSLLEIYQKLLNEFPEIFGSMLIHTQLVLPVANSKTEQEKIDHQYRGVDVMGGSMNLPGLYHMAQVYCYPAKLDGLGLSLLEAMVNGLAIICPDAPPWNEFVTNEVNGFLIPIIESLSREREDGIVFKEVFIDQQKFLEAMIELYKNENKRFSMGQNSIRVAEEKLNWNKFKERIKECLEEL